MRNGDYIQIPEDLPRNLTWARERDGSEVFQASLPTYGTANHYIQTPVLSADSGFYESSFSLEISAANGTTIWYTTDCSDPATSETRIRYQGAISITDPSEQPNVINAISPGYYANRPTYLTPT